MAAQELSAEEALWRIADFIEPHWRGAGAKMTGDWLFNEIVARSHHASRMEEALEEIAEMAKQATGED